MRPGMDYFLEAEGEGQTSNLGKDKFFTEKWSKLLLI